MKIIGKIILILASSFSYLSLIILIIIIGILSAKVKGNKKEVALKNCFKGRYSFFNNNIIIEIKGIKHNI